MQEQKGENQQRNEEIICDNDCEGVQRRCGIKVELVKNLNKIQQWLSLYIRLLSYTCVQKCLCSCVWVCMQFFLSTAVEQRVCAALLRKKGIHLQTRIYLKCTQTYTHIYIYLYKWYIFMGRCIKKRRINSHSRSMRFFVSFSVFLRIVKHKQNQKCNIQLQYFIFSPEKIISNRENSYVVLYKIETIWKTRKLRNFIVI